MKLLIVIVVLFGALIAGLAYLPPETTTAAGLKAAGIAVKGSKGAKAFVKSFKAKWESEKVGSDGEAEKAAPDSSDSGTTP